jgi:hypothetical protein
MAAENLALRHQLGVLLWSKPARGQAEKKFGVT